MHHNTKLSSAIALLSAWMAGGALVATMTGCGLVKINGRPVQLADSGSRQASSSSETAPSQTARANDASSTSPSGQSAESTAPAKPLSPVDQLSETELVDMAVRAILGTLHQITDLPKQKGSGVPVAEGQFALKTKADVKRFDARVNELVVKYAGASDARTYFETTLPQTYCVHDRKLQQRQSKAEAEAWCANNWNVNYYDSTRYTACKFGTVRRGHNQNLAQLYLETLLKGVSDATQQKAHREAFIANYGNEVEAFSFPVSDVRYTYDYPYGFRFKPVPMSQWSQRTLSNVLAYAQAHNVSTEQVQKLKTHLAKADRYRCYWRKGLVARDYEGGGKYGQLRKGSFSGPVGRGGMVPCQEISKLRSNRAYLKLLRGKARNPKDLLAVTDMSGESWKVKRAPTGIILSKSLVVKVIEREEF